MYLVCNTLGLALASLCLRCSDVLTVNSVLQEQRACTRCVFSLFWYLVFTVRWYLDEESAWTWMPWHVTCWMSIDRKNGMMWKHENTHNRDRCFTAKSTMQVCHVRSMLWIVPPGNSLQAMFTVVIVVLLYCMLLLLSWPYPTFASSLAAWCDVLGRSLWRGSSRTVCGWPASCFGPSPSYSCRGSPTSTSSLSKSAGTHYYSSIISLGFAFILAVVTVVETTVLVVVHCWHHFCFRFLYLSTPPCCIKSASFL